MNEFKTAVVNEPSVFEPLKFYCIWYISVFSSIFTKGSNICGFQLACLENKVRQKWDLIRS